MDPSLAAEVWIAAGVPGFSGDRKARRTELLDGRFGPDGWRWAHVVRGQVVPFTAAIAEYEQAYRVHLRRHPALVELMVRSCGNVYDNEPANVHDDDYLQPHTASNHYQDIAVRRVVAELVDDPDWPDVTATPVDTVDLVDPSTGLVHHVPRAAGFRGSELWQIRDADSPGYCLNPAVVPVHDPTLLTTMPGRLEWYHHEGCAHLSVEAFWQMSKVVEVRYDRFVALGAARAHALDGL